MPSSVFPKLFSILHSCRSSSLRQVMKIWAWIGFSFPSPSVAEKNKWGAIPIPWYSLDISVCDSCLGGRADMLVSSAVVMPGFFLPQEVRTYWSDSLEIMIKTNTLPVKSIVKVSSTIRWCWLPRKAKTHELQLMDVTWHLEPKLSMSLLWRSRF